MKSPSLLIVSLVLTGTFLFLWLGVLKNTPDPKTEDPKPEDLKTSVTASEKPEMTIQHKDSQGTILIHESGLFEASGGNFETLIVKDNSKNLP